MKNKNVSSESSGSFRQSRREFILKAVYASPVLLTLPAAPSFAQQGSGDGGSAGGGVCPAGEFDLCTVTTQSGESICGAPIEDGGLIVPPDFDGGPICAS